MAIDYYFMLESPPCRAVSLTANMLGIKMNEQSLNLLTKAHMSEDMLKINPRHVLPFIVDGSLKINESRAIMCYLANKYQPNNNIYPRDAAMRARVEELLYFDASTLFPKASQVLRPILFGLAHTINVDHLKEFKDALNVLEQKLNSNGGKKFILGDELTLADISFAATLSMPMNIGLSSVDMEEFKYVNAYFKNLEDSIPNYHDISDSAIENMKKFMEKNQSK